MEKPSLRKILNQYIMDDLKSIEIYSAYGGSHLNYIKVSEIKEVLNSTDREVNVDFHISKSS